MIYEYAISPTVLKKWASDRKYAKEFFREYGKGTPRIISSFPSAKPTKLRSYLLKNGFEDSESSASQRYIEMVTKLIEAVILRPASADSSIDWCKMIEQSHEAHPFEVIISEPKLEFEESLCIESIYDDNSIWEHKTQISVPRKIDAFSDVLSNFFKYSTKQIIIIDPYCYKSKAKQFIQKLVLDLRHSRLSEQLPVINIFYAQNKVKSSSTPDPAYIKREILEGIKIEGLKLCVYLVAETDHSDAFHNRYILTEHGGISMGHGLDLSEKEKHTDELFLLNKDIYDKKWDQFVDNCCFDIVAQA